MQDSISMRIPKTKDQIKLDGWAEGWPQTMQSAETQAETRFTVLGTRDKASTRQVAYVLCSDVIWPRIRVAEMNLPCIWACFQREVHVKEHWTGAYTTVISPRWWSDWVCEDTTLLKWQTLNPALRD